MLLFKGNIGNLDGPILVEAKWDYLKAIQVLQ